MSRKSVTLFGVRLDSTTREGVLNRLEKKLAIFGKNITTGRSFYMVTPNPEHITRAIYDKRFRDILNKSEISIPDGIGLAQAVKFLSLSSPKNALIKPSILFAQGLYVGLATFIKKDWLQTDIKIIPGRIIFEDIIKLSHKNKWRVYLLGGFADYAKRTTIYLKNKYPKAQIDYSYGALLDTSGNPINKDEAHSERDAITKINKFAPHVLIVGFSSPKQEIWLDKHLPTLKVGCAMVVGRSFDWYSGASRLAPTWMSSYGIEWLWRLLTGSTTLKRIFTAFPLFPLRVFVYKLRY